MDWGFVEHFNPDWLKLYWLKGAATLGTSCIIGQANLGQVDDTRTDVPISTLSITDGFTIGDEGELSLDPATGTATFAEFVDDATPGRTNVLTDQQASVEAGNTEWLAEYPGTTQLDFSYSWAHHGVGSIAATMLTMVPDQTGRIILKNYVPNLNTYGSPVWTFSARISLAAGSPVTIRAEIIWIDRSSGTPTEVGRTIGPTATVTGDSEQLVYATGASPPVYADAAKLALRLVSGYDIGTCVHFDGFMMENNPKPGFFHLGYEPSNRLEVRDRIEITYRTGPSSAENVLFQGIVTEVEVGVEASNEAVRQGHIFERRSTYTLRSFAAQLLDQDVTYTDLPAEPAVARVRRWFTVNTANLSELELDAVNAAQAPEIAGTGSMRYIDIIRNFTTQSGYPLRIVPSLPVSWTSLEVVPASQSYGATAPSWAKSITWKASDATGGVLYPTDAAVQTDSVVFLAGTREIAVADPGKIGSTFRIGSSRIGASYDVNAGFQAGTRIDFFGTTMVVSRMTTTFTKTAATTIELAVPTYFGGYR